MSYHTNLPASVVRPPVSPVPAKWHRDIGPGEPAPLRGMISNMQHHGPATSNGTLPSTTTVYCGLFPGSHRRVNTDAENQQLTENASVPLPGGMPVELNAGDGVVYTHLLLHWEVTTVAKCGAHCIPAIVLCVFPPFPTFTGDIGSRDSYHYLSDAREAQFEAWDALFFAEFDLIAKIFHAIINKALTYFRRG